MRYSLKYSIAAIVNFTFSQFLYFFHIQFNLVPVRFLTSAGAALILI